MGYYNIRYLVRRYRKGSRNPNTTPECFNILVVLSRGFSAAFTGLVETILDPIHEAIYG